jgi:hypothetical protein
MGKLSFLEAIREWIGSVAFKIHLWAYRMSVDEFRALIYEDIAREEKSERESAWLTK